MSQHGKSLGLPTLQERGDAFCRFPAIKAPLKGAGSQQALPARKSIKASQTLQTLPGRTSPGREAGRGVSKPAAGMINMGGSGRRGGESGWGHVLRRGSAGEGQLGLWAAWAGKLGEGSETGSPADRQGIQMT